MSRVVECARCQRTRDHYAKGLCRSCYFGGRQRIAAQRPRRHQLAKRLRKLAARIEGR